MTDWKKHLEVHFEDIDNDNKTKDFEVNIRDFLNGKYKGTSIDDFKESETIKRALELCEDLDNYRSLIFAGNELENQVINVPLTLKDFEILFLALNEDIDRKLIETYKYVEAFNKNNKNKVKK